MPYFSLRWLLVFLTILGVSLSREHGLRAQTLSEQPSAVQSTPESSEPSVWDSLWDTLNPYKIAQRSAARFHAFIRDQLVDFLNESFQGTVQIGRTEGSVLGGTTFHAVSLQYQGVEILTIPRLTVSYELTQLVQGRIQVSQLEGFEPQIRLSQDTQGNWNIAEAFSAPTEQPEEPTEESDEEGGLDIVLEKVLLHGAQLDISLQQNDPQAETTHYQLADTDLAAKIDIVAAGLDVQVQQLVTRLIAENLPPLQATAVLAYQGSAFPPTVNVEQLSLESDQSQLQLAGTIHNLDTLETDATLTLDKLAVADARQVLPDWPLKEDVSGSLQVNGPLADMHGQLDLTTAAASVQATLQADLSQDEPRYNGTLTLAQFDVQKTLTLEEFAGIVEGTIEAQGVGTAVATIDGTADLHVQALHVAGWHLGTVELNGSLAKQLATLRGQLNGDLGQASWDGTLNLGQEQLSYKLSVSVEDFDAKKVVQEGQAIKSDLSLTGTVQGRGFSLATMQTQADIEIRPSTVGPVKVHSGRVLGQIADQRIQIEKASLTATDAHIDIQGELGTSLEEDGQLSYALQVKNVSPWLSLIDQQGRGAVAVTGEAHGNLDQLDVQGELTAQALHVAENTVQDGTVRFDLHDVGQSRPYGTLSAVVHDLNAGLALQTAQATVELPQRPETAPLIAQVNLQARDQTARSHHLAGEISYQESQLAAQLSAVSLELADGTWQLSQPARLVYTRDGKSDRVSVEQLVITNHDQELRLDGQAGLSGEQNLDLQLNGFALDSFRTLLENPPDVQGRLSVHAQLNGTAAAPRLEAQLNVADLSVTGQEYTGLSSTLRYADKQASVDVTFQQDDTHVLQVTGALPVQASWADGWQMQTTGDMDVRVHSSGLNLAVLNAFSGEAVQHIAGELGLDVRLQGPLTHPVPRGSFQLHNGGAQLDPLGVRLAEITVDGEVDPEQIRFSQIGARAEEGKLTGSGTITLRNYAPDNVNLLLSLDRWPAVHTHTYQVSLNGQVEATGPLTAPQIQADLSVPQATIRPNLKLLEESPIQRDETIIIVSSPDVPESPATDEKAQLDTEEELQTIGQTETTQELSLDVHIALPRNTWIKHRNADIELAGQVHAVQTPGNALELVGTIQVVRGWVGSQGRRFTVSQGQVVFTGGEQIDPSLDIVATYQTSDRDYTIELIIGGTAQKPTLTLQSEPPLEQADILAVLMFGKPVSALGQGEKVDLQKQALSITSGYAARKIGQSVSAALGLESLGVDLREVDLTGGRVGFGRYIGDKTYVSAAQDLSGKRGREVSVDYQLSPEWNITTSTSTTGNNEAGITWQKRY